METQLRLISFLTLFIVLAITEKFKPAWSQQPLRAKRWPLNAGLLLIGSILARALVGMTLLEAALWAQQQQLGLFNQLTAPALISSITAYVLLDFAIYWQHVVSHRWPLFWRFHKVHHADTALDVSSALRFHPIEGIVSMLYKIGLVIFLGAPAMAVMAFELALNLGASFNHANIHIPKHLDQKLRCILVTPSFHRSHHSPTPAKTNSNYGFLLPWWDYLFSSHARLPNDDDDGQVGLNLATPLNPNRLKHCLVDIPLRS